MKKTAYICDGCKKEIGPSNEYLCRFFRIQPIGRIEELQEMRYHFCKDCEQLFMTYTKPEFWACLNDGKSPGEEG